MSNESTLNKPMSAQGAPIRILIVDDHAVLRAALRVLLECHAQISVVGEAADRAAAFALAAAELPDIILLDLDLGHDSGFDLLPQLLDVAPEARVIVLTGLRNPEAHQRAVLLGAVGVVLKEKGIETVLKAIEKVHAGEVWLDRSMIAGILNSRARGQSAPMPYGTTAKIAALTERECQVIRLIGEGLQNHRIAERLVISEATVRHHLTSIFAKLGVSDRFELVVYAYRHGLANIPQ